MPASAENPGALGSASGQFVVGAMAFSQRPFDGHTPDAFLQQVERMMGQPFRGETYVDKDYRGHNYERPARALIAKFKRRQEPHLRRWYRKRNGIGAAIGHAKSHRWLRRNYLKGMIGSRIDALLSACG